MAGESRFARFLDATFGTAADAVRGIGRSSYREPLKEELAAIPRLAFGTLPHLASALVGGTMVDAVLRNANKRPNGVAFVMDRERLTWRDVDAMSSRLAHVLTGEGVRPGDVVALLGGNSPTYVALVLGIARAGATAALVNHHLTGRPLAHAIDAASARLVIAHERFTAALDEAEVALERKVYGGGALEEAMARAPLAPFAPVKPGAREVLGNKAKMLLTGESPEEPDYIYIYTSGTTGLPKPCRISHARALTAAAGFAKAVFELTEDDVVYSPLPLYHASGLMLGAGSCIITGATLAIRDGFSASAYWDDIHRYDATAILYIGELCRYLVAAPEQDGERDHQVRIAVGNGLRPDVWPRFQERFGIETIREFYAATEAPGFIVNLEGRVGAVGHVPWRRSGWMRLVKYDVETDTHERGPDGFLIDCEPGEPGELLVRLSERPITAASEFRGYTSEEATQKKILHDVFRDGDRYFRTGDLLRRDEDDYFYFVDRIGDTYRWKGENVSTAEVADTLAESESIAEVTVVGVAVPGQEGRAGLAVVVPAGGAFDASAFTTAAERLPAYARPRFVRVTDALETTGTHKVRKTNFASDGVDPAMLDDDLYVLDGATYAPMDEALWAKVQDGTHRL